MRLGGELGKPEIENLGLAALRDEDAGGFDVPVDDTLGVRRIQCIGNLNGEIE